MDGKNGSEHFGFLEEEKSSQLCGYWGIVGECEHNHRFAKSLDCGREWCLECKDRSHNRRFSRWLLKAQKINEMGYMVVTFPENKRPRLKNKLSKIGILITEGLIRRGIKRGLRRWHFFGDRNNDWYPHINFLFEAGYFNEEELASVKMMIREVLGIPEAVIYYQYTQSVKKMIHWLKYVTRPTFLKREWDEEMACELYNFRNCVQWGKWDDEDKWSLPEIEKSLGYVAKIERSICPVCGSRIRWGMIVPLCELNELDDFEQIWHGFWQVNPGPEIALVYLRMKAYQDSMFDGEIRE